MRKEVPGLNHNAFDGFLGLRVAIFALGAGRNRMSRFTYRPIEETVQVLNSNPLESLAPSFVDWKNT